MRRGTTPTHNFTTDISLVDAEVIYITYQQGGVTVLEFEKGDRLSVSDENISVKLTQEETLRFSYPVDVEIQIRAKFADGTAVGCDIIKVPVERILKGGEI